jgi:hypothetical protein
MSLHRNEYPIEQTGRGTVAWGIGAADHNTNATPGVPISHASAKPYL